MIRLRNTDGTTTALQQEARFVEICSEDGLVAAVLIDRKDGTVRMLEAGDAEMDRYIRAFPGVKLAQLSRHEAPEQRQG